MTSFAAYDLILASKQPGCPACRLEEHTVERFIAGQLYESVNEIELRDRLRLSRGYCREHVWLAVDKHLGDALGFAIIYHDVINATARRLEEVLSPPGQGVAGLQKRLSEKLVGTLRAVTQAISPQKPCPACEERVEITRILINALVKEIHDARVVEALQASDGLCFRHLRLTLESMQDPAGFETVLAIHRSKLEALKAELAELIRKNDHRYIHEGFGAEGDSWRRAIGLVAGASDRE